MITVVFLFCPPPLSQLTNNALGRGRVKSAAYRSWISFVEQITPRPLKPVTGPVAIQYEFLHPGDRRRRDLFNLEKATSDMLVNLGYLEDDSQIVDGRLLWVSALERGEVRITITPTGFPPG